MQKFSLNARRANDSYLARYDEAAEQSSQAEFLH